MCGRFILVQKLETIEKRFNLSPSLFDLSPSYNTGPGMYTPVVASNSKRCLQLFRFGMCPSWAKKDMFLLNARTEGDRNSENDVHYHGPKDIILKPSFRKPIRSQRCLVIADAFIEGSTDEGLDKAHVVFLKNKVRPFAMAGIWDEWKNPVNGESVFSFAIITTVANELMQKIPHHRSPVILEPWQESVWLNNDAPLSDITAILKPYDSNKMNAYPIKSSVKNQRNNFPELLKPIGTTLNDEAEIAFKESLYRQGFGRKDA